MSCFLVPMTEAAVAAVIRKSSHGNNKSLAKLETMLWGGSLLLCAEHLIRGEFGLNFYEMTTNGVAMSVIVTAFWVLLRKKETRTVSMAVLGALLMVAVDLGFTLL